MPRLMGIRPRASLGALAAVWAAALATVPAVDAAPTEQRAAIRPCSRGLVALTFDDGPSVSVTPRLLDELHSRRAPATFFVVGGRVAAAPQVVRRMHALGFKIGNHTYAHEALTSLSDRAIVSTLRRTRRAVTSTGAEISNLMRPPYGLINPRVRAVVNGIDLTPVMWTVDPRDWEVNVGSAVIADRVIGGLRPDGTNVVLLHDGVGNSASTLRAVPDIIGRARSRGYCFAALGAKGNPKPPVPVVRVSDAAVRERTAQAALLRFTVRLDRPTSRPTSVRVMTSDRTATAGKDYASTSRRIRFPVGTTRRVVSVRVFGDAVDEPRESLVLTASGPRGLTVRDKTGVGRIDDDDAPPAVTVHDLVTSEPGEGTASAEVPVTLSAPSGRRVMVSVETQPGTAGVGDFVATAVEVLFAPGQVTSLVPVGVLADDEAEGTEQFTLLAVSARNATVADGTASITIDEPL